MVVVDAQTQVTEHAVNQAPGRGKPAAQGDQRTLPVQLVVIVAPFGVPIPNPPSGWMVSPVMPRDRSEAKNTKAHHRRQRTGSERSWLGWTYIPRGWPRTSVGLMFSVNNAQSPTWRGKRRRQPISVPSTG